MMYRMIVVKIGRAPKPCGCRAHSASTIAARDSMLAGEVVASTGSNKN